MQLALCRHIKTNGLQCRGISLADSAFCYYHSRLHRNHAPYRLTGAAAGYLVPGQDIQLAPLEDRDSVQVALSRVINALATGNLEVRRATVLLYGLQLAAANAGKLQPNYDAYTTVREPGPAPADSEAPGLDIAPAGMVYDSGCHDPFTPIHLTSLADTQPTQAQPEQKDTGTFDENQPCQDNPCQDQPEPAETDPALARIGQIMDRFIDLAAAAGPSSPIPEPAPAPDLEPAPAPAPAPELKQEPNPEPSDPSTPPPAPTSSARGARPSPRPCRQTRGKAPISASRRTPFSAGPQPPRKPCPRARAVALASAPLYNQPNPRRRTLAPNPWPLNPSPYDPHPNP